MLQEMGTEGDWSASLPLSKNSYGYAKVFNGYGESLIYYDRSVSKVSFGFAFYLLSISLSHTSKIFWWEVIKHPVGNDF